MSLAQLRAAVALARDYPGAKLEASGGLRLDTARTVAQTGVDYLSAGALTHSSPALDLGLDLRAESPQAGPASQASQAAGSSVSEYPIS
jgi:nicotinate-nucleotide pyrophosphorylase